jgi:hypothetical protein
LEDSEEKSFIGWALKGNSKPMRELWLLLILASRAVMLPR